MIMRCLLYHCLPTNLRKSSPIVMEPAAIMPMSFLRASSVIDQLLVLLTDTLN
jgi:hypothetical protein